VLDWLQISLPELFALLAAVAFAAGLNVYATVGALGLLARFGHLLLPPGLQLLESWPVIAASIILFAIEFFADKIPAFDLISRPAWQDKPRSGSSMSIATIGGAPTTRARGAMLLTITSWASSLRPTIRRSL